MFHARSWCTPGHLLLSLSLDCFCLFVCFVVFFDKYTWDSSRSWCTPGCQSFLICPIGVAAGVSVSLATHVLSFFTLTWESSKSWCALGCPSFLLSHLFHSPTWDSSQSWYALGCPSFLLSLSGVVAGVSVPLAIHLWFFVVVVVSFFV